MDPALQALIGKPFASVEDVIGSLTALEQYFIDRLDRRAVFVTAYNSVSRTIGQWVAEKRFQDSTWVHAYGTAFGNLYRQALLGYETGQPLPEAWRISFSNSQAGKMLVTQDLVLGIHAHVNRDLAFALASVGVDGDRAAKHGDHNLVNQVLDSVTDEMQDRIAKLYAKGLGVLDRLLGPLDELFGSFSVRVAREIAWQNGVALAAAGEGSAIARHIEQRADHLARLLLRPNHRLPWIIDALKHAEEVLGWISVVRP